MADNAFQQPDVSGNTAGNAAMAMRYYPHYQQALINGDVPDGVSFQQWLPVFMKQQQQPQQQQPTNNAFSGY